MNLLISGGLGYIGSHTIIELLKKENNLVIVDNLINSQIETLNYIKIISSNEIRFFNLNASDYKSMQNIFKEHNFDGIIHFAGYKSVSESIDKPLIYYENNIFSTITLIKLALEYNVPKFIFSSSATVYGNGASPYFESSPLLERTNPYGETKAMNERILIDTVNANPKLNVTILRYFNPVGAHKSGLIGEKPNGVPNNLMPYITQVAIGIREKLFIYGNDYDTPDGTGVRDYIHVVDLAKGHVAALESNRTGLNIYNLGTGKGTSVLEMVNAFEKYNKVKIPYVIINRRPGDIGECYADVSKAKRELNWEAKLTLEDMVKDAWNFEKNLKKKNNKND